MHCDQSMGEVNAMYLQLHLTIFLVILLQLSVKVLQMYTNTILYLRGILFPEIMKTGYKKLLVE